LTSLPPSPIARVKLFLFYITNFTTWAFSDGEDL
jgi:hypothetical protein